MLDKNEASALGRLFSAAVMHDFGRRAFSPLFTRLLGCTRLATQSTPESTVGTVLDDAFDLLSRSKLRDDYVYRSAITQKILLGRHNLNTATLLNEVRAGVCKADVVVLNGTSTAYEIKSERDTLARLHNQISNYRQVFATVNVVTGKSHVSEVLKNTPEDVGVIVLSDRFSFHEVRRPENHPERIVPSMVFDVLRVNEATEILRRLGREIPEVPNTQVRFELGRIFAELDPIVAHDEMVRTLRASRSQANLAGFVRSLPVSIRSASLALKPSLKSRVHIKEAVETPLTKALAWK